MPDRSIHAVSTGNEYTN